MAFDRKAYYKSDKKKEIDRKYYEENKEKSLSRSRQYRKRYKEWFKKIKDGLVCGECGFTGHGEAIDFHHPEDDKSKDVARLAGETSSKKRILEEMKKCKVLCANCHRILHGKIR